MHHLTEPEWIAIAAHRLQHRWRTVDPEQLDEVAGELWHDVRLRELEPNQAIDAWLTPLAPSAGVPSKESEDKAR